MELLVVTLAQVNASREADALVQMRIISDTVRNAPGLLNARFYRSKEPGISYCMLTTWESSEWWQKAQERYAPQTLLLASPPGVFHLPPDQWLMSYLWGYSRPLARQAIATAYLALVRPEMVEHVQQAWLESLHHQAFEPLLSFALLARNLELTKEEPIPPSTSESAESSEESTHPSIKQGTMFFSLQSWPGESYREDFYADEHAQNMRGLLNRTGIMHILALDPL